MDRDFYHNKIRLLNKSISTFQAYFILGLNRGYSNETFTKNEAILALQNEQKKIAKAKNIISASVEDCSIVCMGQNEKSLKISFINYPVNPIEIEELKSVLLKLMENLMVKFDQNRCVLVCTDETIMLSSSDEIDPKIKNC